MEVGGTWENSGDSWPGLRECRGKDRPGAPSESLSPRRGNQMGPTSKHLKAHLDPPVNDVTFFFNHGEVSWGPLFVKYII